MNAIFITVRTGSSRLPNKSILDLCGKPSIKYLIDNVKQSTCADKVILCTTDLHEDSILCDIAYGSDIDCFRGSAEDKLSRWLGACQQFDIDFFVNVDGDDLFLDFGLADIIIQQWDVNKPDIINGRGVFYNDIYGVSRTALSNICKKKTDNKVEHVWPYFSNNSLTIETPNNIPSKYLKTSARMTLDYKEDFLFFEAVIHKLKGKKITFDNILITLKQNPSIEQINNHLELQWSQNQQIQINENR